MQTTKSTSEQTARPEAGEPRAPLLKTLGAKKAGPLDPGDTVENAGTRLREHHAERWPVAAGEHLVGMVDESNPDWKLGGNGHDPKDWKVGEIMSSDLVFCYEDQDCATARQLMKDRDLSFLPVVDRQMRIVGVFSREEIEEQSRGLNHPEEHASP